MNFEDFRKDLESKIKSIAKFELQEFHFEPHSFGNGILVYKIKGRNHKFIYDGRENEINWSISKPHEKYLGASFIQYKIIDGLRIERSELEKGI